MIFRIDQASPDPIYLQIRACVVAGIATGDLQPGDTLPSVRALAADLGVNLHTVNKAYAMLRDEGYLFMRGRAGAMVADPSGQSKQRAAGVAARVEEALYRLALEAKAAGMEAPHFESLAAAQIEQVWAGATSHAAAPTASAAQSEQTDSRERG